VVPPTATADVTPADAALGATGTVVTADGRRLPAGAPPLGFEGYCPVTMRKQWKWVAGDPRWGAIHRGRTFWFASPVEQQQFLAEPDLYGPALSGIDPVMAIDHSQTIPGKREHSIDYDDQFYFFSSEATLQQFTSSPQRYATGVRQAMGLGPNGAVR
jgi:protein disulfide-isomerase